MNISQEIRTTFNNLQHFHSEKAHDLKATIQLILVGEEGGNFVLHINDGQITTEIGQARTPDLTLTMGAEEYLFIMRGEADPLSMVIKGQIDLEGDRFLAMRLGSILRGD